MPHYMVYHGPREGTHSVNSRAHPGQKLRVTRGLPFEIDDGDLWMASIRGMQVLSTLNFVPTTIRQPHGDPTYCSPWEGAFLEGLVANCPDPAHVVEIGFFVWFFRLGSKTYLLPRDSASSSSTAMP